MTNYINGSMVAFDTLSAGATMSVTFITPQRHAALSPQPVYIPRREHEAKYVLSYSPATGNAINGVSTRDIAWTPEMTAFVKNLTGGVKFADVYARMLREHVAYVQRTRRNHDYSAPTER